MEEDGAAHKGDDELKSRIAVLTEEEKNAVLVLLRSIQNNHGE